MAPNSKGSKPLPIALKVSSSMSSTTTVPGSTELATLVGSSCSEAVRRMSVGKVALLTAVIGTVAFYLPLLSTLQPDNVAWPPFLLTHDQRSAYFPYFVEGYRRFWQGGLLGMDFFTQDGASIFAYRPNFAPFYPPYIVAYLLVDCSILARAMRAFVVINIAHTFAGLYFSVVFARRYLGLPSGAAVLAATVYCLTWIASNYATTQATFYFQMMLVPVLACCLCMLIQRGSLIAAVLASPVFVTYMLCNYAPTMLVGFGSAAMAATLVLFLDTNVLPGTRIRALAMPAISVFLAGLVCLPYYYAQLRFNRLMLPPAADIGSVAHQLSLTGYDLASGFSQFLHFRRTQYEVILAWGLIPLLICLFGMHVAIGHGGLIARRYLVTSGVCSLVYLAILLPCFGSSLVAVTDAFFYAVPIIGKMHIYQRYLMFAQFFFALMVGALATVGVLYGSKLAKRVLSYAGIAIWIGTVVICSAWPNAAPPAVNELMVESFLLAIAAIALAVGAPTPAFLVASALCAATGLYTSYAVALGAKPAQWLKEPDPRGSETRDLVAFINANSDGKALSKVVIASTAVATYFNRNLPWQLGSQVKMMNFQGYPPHLSVVADYASAFGNYGVFDIPWIGETGVDFVAFDEADRGPLNKFLAVGYQIGPVLVLSAGNRLAKLIPPPSFVPDTGAALDLSRDNAAAWPAAMELDGWAIREGRLVKVPGKEDRFGYRVNQTVGRIYDVSLDVDDGSVGSIRVAYGSEVLANQRVTGAEHFTKRVTLASPGDLWISTNADFKGSISNIKVQERALRPQPEAFDNGLLRMAGNPGEIKSSTTNYTNNIKLDVDLLSPRSVTYLFWPNPYMVPYLDGEQVQWTTKDHAPLTFTIPQGHHTFEVRFVDLPGRVFKWLQTAYWCSIGLGFALYGWSVVRATRNGGTYLWRRRIT